MGLGDYKSRTEPEMNIEEQIALVHYTWERNKSIYKQHQQWYENHIEQLRVNQKKFESRLHQSHRDWEEKLKQVEANNKAVVELLCVDVKMKDKEVMLLREFVQDLKNELHGRAKSENEKFQAKINQLENENKVLRDENYGKSSTIEALMEMIATLQKNIKPTNDAEKQEIPQEKKNIGLLDERIGEYEDDFESEDDEDVIDEIDDAKEDSSHNEDEEKAVVDVVDSSIITTSNIQKGCKTIQPNVVLDKQPEKSILKKTYTVLEGKTSLLKCKRYVNFDKTTYFQLIDNDNTVSHGNYVDALKPPGDIFFGMSNGALVPTEFDEGVQKSSKVNENENKSALVMKHSQASKT